MAILHLLQDFAAAVTEKSGQLGAGQPEEQLRAPFERFLGAVGAEFGQTVVCTGETPLPGRLGRPDFAVHTQGLLTGYVELKRPGAGAESARFRDHDRDQFRRFSAIPNLLYTDGNEWALYRNGKRGRLVRLAGAVDVDGREAAITSDADALERLLRAFLAWEPVLPWRGGKLDLRGFATLTAPLCAMLRDDVAEALSDSESALSQLAADWRELLFQDATDAQFADAYAQTVTFALLLGRSEGADPLNLDTAREALVAEHSLLARALQVLTDTNAQQDVAASLGLLLRVMATLPADALNAPPTDPWLYFYEDFLAVYDPKLRRDAGAYYTPVEVVRAQVRLVDELLVQRLARRYGFADTDVVTLDPAVGTGTYMLGVLEHALQRIAVELGEGAVPGRATRMADNLHAFELLVGPYAVTQLRLSKVLLGCGAELPKGGPHVYLADTLESPHVEPKQTALFFRPLAEQRLAAAEVKRDTPVLVCLGNPPYDRHEAATATNGDRTGSWVRWGDDGDRALLDDFARPAKDAGQAVRLKNLYNLYVYFWRWALWKVFEREESSPGIVSFITASSYLDGDAFRGVREHMRRVCDELWILDLGGEGRGSRGSANVFAIKTPVAIAVAFRGAEGYSPERPAAVHYARIDGSRTEKLAALDAIGGFADVEWEECDAAWQAPFRPAGKGAYFRCPLLADLMPWQHSGVQLKRTWPIAPDAQALAERWRALLEAKDRAEAFRETSDRKIDGTYRLALTDAADDTPVVRLGEDAPPPPILRYAFRSFDRQYLLGDARLMSRPRPDLWRAHSDHQVYITTLLYSPLGNGPAATASAALPDLHHFSGRGAKDVIPLYRTADAGDANVAPGLLDMLGATYGRAVTAEDFAAYVFAVLAQPAFTARFARELETSEVRVPLTKDARLFGRARDIGARLLWLHTFGERFPPNGAARGSVPTGEARCTKAVSRGAYPEAFRFDAARGALQVGDGEFGPVTAAAYEFEVSGLKPLQSWLRNRMAAGAGRRSSPLDRIRSPSWTTDYDTELLELLWVLEATVAGFDQQAQLLDELVAGECFDTDELPEVPEARRRPPDARKVPASMALL